MWDEIENLTLIENGLSHLLFEFGRAQPSYFRMVREAHLVLYRAMIEALKGSANATVTGRGRKDRRCKYQVGNKPFSEIHRAPVPGCKRAWRYTEPQACEEPSSFALDLEPGEQEQVLVHFYDALAMVQTEPFMGISAMSKAIRVSDKDMATLEWVHERIRNEYEHFIPKLYMAPVASLLRAAYLCISLARALLMDSGSVWFDAIPRDQIDRLLADALRSLGHQEQNVHVAAIVDEGQ